MITKYKEVINNKYISNNLGKKYRKDLEGLRGLAVLAVTLYHLFPNYAGGGFVGVDIFFILSGYLITNIFLKNYKNKSFTFLIFLKARIIRLFPALILVVCSYIFIFFIFFTPLEAYSTNREIFYVLSFISNFFYLLNINYFATENNFIFTHTWSLSIEIQFYVFAFFIFFISWRLKIFNNLQKLLLILLIFFCSFFFFFYTINSNLNNAYFSTFLRFWEFFLGGFVSLFKHNFNNKITSTVKNSNYLSFFCGMSIICIFYFGNFNSILNYYLIILLTLSTAFIIYADNDCFFNKYILSNKILVNFGLISYPLYLWHFFLLKVASSIFITNLPTRNIRISLFFISIFISYITYSFVEKFFRSKKNYNQIILIFFIYSFFFTILLATKFSLNHKISEPVFFLSDKIKREFSGGIWNYQTNDLCLLDHANNYQIYKTFSYWICLKNKDHNPTIAILGNSFSNAYYPGFIYNDEFNNHTFLNIGSCDFLSKYKPSNSKKDPCGLYQSFREMELIDTIIKKNESIKFVIISGLDKNINYDNIEALTKKIEEFEKLNKQVIIFTGVYYPNFSLKKCYTTLKLNLIKDVCDFEKRNIDQNQHDNLITLINKKNPKTLFFNPNQIFDCLGDKCSFVKDGIPLFRDDIHLSKYGSKIAIEKFSEWAKINLPSIF
jgi:peptidoglycan/LPS O-acetylase OafA/YrhL